MRTIDADALMEGLVRERTICPDCSEVAVCIGSGCSTQAVIKAIISAPTIDAEPVKHGEWLEWELFSTNSRWYRYECSCCGEKYNKDITYWKFCPECGAKMDGGKTDGE